MLPCVALLVLAACASAPPPAPAATAEPTAPPRPPPFPAYTAPSPPREKHARVPPRPTLLRGGTVMTATGQILEDGWVLMAEGRIAAVGRGTSPTGEHDVVELKGRFVTPGIIDTHSHMGVYPLPYSSGNSDGNEATDPTTPEVWAEHGFWPQDPALPRAVAGGITTIQVLPGSANLIGGRSFVAKLHLGTSARAMRFPDAPQGLKMACGENPKRVYGDEQHRAPSTRMGNVYGYRKAFQDAWDYRRRVLKYQRDILLWQQRQLKAETSGPKKGDDDKGPDDPPEPPARDFALETLADVLDGKILVHNHCYRADEMNLMLDLAREYRFKIRSFHHAVEAYKLAPRLAEEETAVSTWADWWGFKMESYDGIPQNAALLTAAGARAIIHSDSQTEIRHLNQEAAKAMTAGRAIGLPITEDMALRWITANAAWALGVEDKTGTLTPGKMADVVVWDHHPFSVYAKAERVYIDGALVFERGKTRPVTDFELKNGAPVGGVAP
jgi:imidazolonepropionase-like amidohydrolase